MNELKDGNRRSLRGHDDSPRIQDDGKDDFDGKVVGVEWKPAAWEQCHQLPPSSELNSPERKRERLVRTILIVSQE